eukprot:9118249-Lingulodinium_polyedra.AAC.1
MDVDAVGMAAQSLMHRKAECPFRLDEMSVWTRVDRGRYAERRQRRNGPSANERKSANQTTA